MFFIIVIEKQNSPVEETVEIRFTILQIQYTDNTNSLKILFFLCFDLLKF